MPLRSRCAQLLAVALCAAACVQPWLAHESERERGEHHESRRAASDLARMVRRMDRYFTGHAVDGITLDSRFDINPPEAIRQSVVCQLLGYAELNALQPRARFARAIGRDADYLLEHLAEVRSHTPFDGMLGYCLLAAWDVTRDPRHLAAARLVVDEMLAIPTSECILNGGLMVALATARDAELFGTGASATKTSDILAQLPPFQNADGSFPHWCYGSRDIHYTGWMAHELIHLERMTADPLIAPMLARMSAFMEGRIGADGASRYEAPCEGSTGCVQYYYSRATGCGYDYDTRGWTVEPGYQVLLFDHQRSPAFTHVFRFLSSLEKRGTFPDLYAYWPPSDDPEYPWTIADTSVANMSIIFWSLATALRDRDAHDDARLAWSDDEEAAPPPPVEVDPRPLGRPPRAMPPKPLRVSTPHVVGAYDLRFSLRGEAHVTLRVLDVHGRRVRDIDAGQRQAGEQVVRWDQLDEQGARVPNGMYFAALAAGAERWNVRWLVWR